MSSAPRTHTMAMAAGSGSDSTREELQVARRQVRGPSPLRGAGEEGAARSSRYESIYTVSAGSTRMNYLY